MKSSSFHKVTSDRGSFLYKIFARIVHTPLNFINNLYPKKNVDSKLEISYFRTTELEQQYLKLDKLSSPLRKMSDLFWLNTDWVSIQKELSQINICDIGCGSGSYFVKLTEYSKKRINTYTGLDIYENKNWEKLKKKYQNLNFQKYDGKNIVNFIPPNTNLIISQSAIEHFSEDITIFKQIQEFVKTAQNNVYQIHLFPSKETLKLYPFHGVRQYTPRTISKITRLFSDSSSIKLYELGGENSNKLHRNYVSKGLFNRDLRGVDELKYEQDCFEALRKDLEKTQTNEPGFYALVIKTKN